mmetsp:Transcript_46702/g.100617  ORF Transcript_46702/g.100617 Transcript_46702/m.100617 type:complete len:268 (-) Transcript_46702:18-821(-)
MCSLPLEAGPKRRRSKAKRRRTLWLACRSLLGGCFPSSIGTLASPFQSAFRWRVSRCQDRLSDLRLPACKTASSSVSSVLPRSSAGDRFPRDEIFHPRSPPRQCSSASKFRSRRPPSRTRSTSPNSTLCRPNPELFAKQLNFCPGPQCQSEDECAKASTRRAQWQQLWQPPRRLAPQSNQGLGAEEQVPKSAPPRQFELPAKRLKLARKKKREKKKKKKKKKKKLELQQCRRQSPPAQRLARGKAACMRTFPYKFRVARAAPKPFDP